MLHPPHTSILTGARAGDGDGNLPPPDAGHVESSFTEMSVCFKTCNYQLQRADSQPNGSLASLHGLLNPKEPEERMHSISEILKHCTSTVKTRSQTAAVKHKAAR